ncbi:MAG: hypothetical protein AB1426_03385 [Bacillota bacterium]
MAHVDYRFLVVTIGCGQLPKIMEVAAQHDLVVFGTLDGKVLSNLANRPHGTDRLPVYFYESG